MLSRHTLIQLIQAGRRCHPPPSLPTEWTGGEGRKAPFEDYLRHHFLVIGVLYVFSVHFNQEIVGQDPSPHGHSLRCDVSQVHALFAWKKSGERSRDLQS